MNVAQAVYQPIPTSKFYPGKDITVEEMQALYEYLGDSVSDFAFGDNHLMPGNATAGAEFCQKYGLKSDNVSTEGIPAAMSPSSSGSQISRMKFGLVQFLFALVLTSIL